MLYLIETSLPNKDMNEDVGYGSLKIKIFRLKIFNYMHNSEEFHHADTLIDKF